MSDTRTPESDAIEFITGLIADGHSVGKLYRVVRNNIAKERAGKNSAEYIAVFESYLAALDSL